MKILKVILYCAVVDETNKAEGSVIGVNQISLNNGEEIDFGADEIAKFTPFIGLSSERGRYNRRMPLWLQLVSFMTFTVPYSHKEKTIGK